MTDTRPEKHEASAFGDFVVGTGNRLARAAAQTIAEGTSQLSGTTLYLYGPSGSGKTHLLNAIAESFRQRKSTTSVVAMTAEKFVTVFIDAVRNGEIRGFHERVRSAGILLIDDIEYFAGKDRSQEELFYTLDARLSRHVPTVLTGHSHPVQLDGLSPLLVSRLKAGLVVEISPPNTDDLERIAIEAGRRLRIDIPRPVAKFLADIPNADTNTVMGYVRGIALRTATDGGPVTMEMAQETLPDTYSQEHSLLEILERVCRQFNVSVTELRTHRRSKAVAQARNVFALLVRRHKSLSFPEIASAVGVPNHATIITGLARFEKKLRGDPALRSQIEAMERSLFNLPSQRPESVTGKSRKRSAVELKIVAEPRIAPPPADGGELRVELRFDSQFSPEAASAFVDHVRELLKPWERASIAAEAVHG